MLVWGELERSEAKAKKDYDRKMNMHHNQKYKVKVRPQLVTEEVAHMLGMNMKTGLIKWGQGVCRVTR